MGIDEIARREHRTDEIREEIAAAVNSDPSLASVLDQLKELRHSGLLSRPIYRLTSPYGSGMQHLVED